MKPRLDPAPSTEEDKAVWGIITARHPHGTHWWNSRYQDRRDADLMLELADCRRIVGPTSAAIAHHMLRGQIASDGDDAIWISGHPVFLA